MISETVQGIIEKIFSYISGFFSGWAFKSHQVKQKEFEDYKKYEAVKEDINDKYDRIKSKLRLLSEIQEARKARDSNQKPKNSK